MENFSCGLLFKVNLKWRAAKENTCFCLPMQIGFVKSLYGDALASVNNYNLKTGAMEWLSEDGEQRKLGLTTNRYMVSFGVMGMF